MVGAVHVSFSLLTASMYLLSMIKYLLNNQLLINLGISVRECVFAFVCLHFLLLAF